MPPTTPPDAREQFREWLAGEYGCLQASNGVYAELDAIAAKAAELFAPAAASDPIAYCHSPRQIHGEINKLVPGTAPSHMEGWLVKVGGSGLPTKEQLDAVTAELLRRINQAPDARHAAAEVVQGGGPTFEALMETINETPRIGHLLAADKFELAKRIAALFGVHRCIECGGRGKVLDLDGHLDSQWIPCSTCAPPATTTASGGEIRVDGRVCHITVDRLVHHDGRTYIHDGGEYPAVNHLGHDGKWHAPGSIHWIELYWDSEAEARAFAQQHADPIQAPSERMGGR